MVDWSNLFDFFGTTQGAYTVAVVGTLTSFATGYVFGSKSSSRKDYDIRMAEIELEGLNEEVRQRELELKREELRFEMMRFNYQRNSERPTRTEEVEERLTS